MESYRIDGEITKTASLITVDNDGDISDSKLA